MASRQGVKGDNNTSIIAENINNYNYQVIHSDTELVKGIREQIKIINEKVNKTLSPEGLFSMRDGKSFPFDCERIIKSNSAIGIPIELTLSILTNAENYFTNLASANIGKKIATSHVRKFVSESLYQTESKSFTKKQTVKWAEEYSRRYGNPNYRLKVITSNGNEIDLTYKYLKEEIIPDVIKKSFPLSIEEIKSDILDQGFSQITEELFEKIKQLNLYFIHFKTIFNIAYDLAIQPPKPWLCSPKYKHRNTEIQLKEAKTKISRARVRYSEKKPCNEHCDQCSTDQTTNCLLIRKKCIDCIDHCSTILLNEHDLFIGSGQLRPFEYLRRFLEISKVEEGHEIIWEKTDLKKISGDLNAISSSKENLISSLNKLKDLMNNTNKDLIHLINNTDKFFLLTQSLIESKRITSANLGFSSSLSFEEKIKLVFKHIPNVVVQNSISDNCFNLNQFINTVFFSKYHTKLKCLFYDENEVYLQNILQDLDKIKNDNFCKLLLIIYNGVFTRQMVGELNNKHFDFEIIPLSFKDFFTIYEAKDRTKRFQELIVNIQNEI